MENNKIIFIESDYEIIKGVTSYEYYIGDNHLASFQLNDEYEVYKIIR